VLDSGGPSAYIRNNGEIDFILEATMLVGVDPILTGRLLAALDEMGHGDMVVIADAHFTAAKLAKRPVIELPGLPSPRVLRAIRRLFVPDDYAEFQMGLMESPAPDLLDVQMELVSAADLGEATIAPVSAFTAPGDGNRIAMIERFAFYDYAAKAELIIRTGETRPYGNALFLKGVTPVDKDWN